MKWTNATPHPNQEKYRYTENLLSLSIIAQFKNPTVTVKNVSTDRGELYIYMYEGVKPCNNCIYTVENVG